MPPKKKITSKKDGHQFTSVKLGEKKPVRKRKVAPKKVVAKKKPAVRKKRVVAPKKRVRPQDKKMKRELREIYENSDGSMPNMADFKKRKKRGFFSAFLVLLFACAFLGAVAWIGFFVFQPMLQFAEEDVTLSISGDEKVTAGQEVKYRIRYRNSQNVDLGQANIQVRYPEGFVFSDSSVMPSNENKDLWELGALGEKDSGYIDIFGRMYGDLDKQQSFRVFLNYMPGNFSSEFQKVETLNTEIKNGPAVMEVQGPKEAVPGVEVEYLVGLEARKDVGIENLALQLESTGGFIVVSSDPESVPDDQMLWNVAGLDESDVVFKIRGVFNPEENQEEVELKFNLVGWKDGDRKVEPYVYSSETSNIVLLRTDLSVNLGINGSLSDINVEPGEILNTSIVIKNAGDSDLKKLSVRLVYETPSYDNRSMLDWYEIEDLEKGSIVGDQINDETRRGIITWDSRHIDKLSKLPAGEEVVIDVSIPFKDADDLDLTKFTNYNSSALVEVKYTSGDEQKILSSNEIKMMVNSDLGLEVRDEVSENLQGKELHTITWFLSNTFHELKDIELSADLYGDIEWQEEGFVVPAGEAVFDKDSDKLIWKVDSMPTSLDVLALQFAVVLKTKNPSQTNLSSKVKLKAKDTITGEVIMKAGDEILLTSGL
ncbi:MAG: hypothetical protein HOD54_03215 [Candidatus Magasanikbacteria bacterium]|jgi:hypothetical protein|nr:hypothetical protein [Candidatus Magasanikbacteria bacterium]MBT4546983.1 hypothetical protein [Candidatus Magasanikbacteria bacterium]